MTMLMMVVVVFVLYIFNPTKVGEVVGTLRLSAASPYFSSPQVNKPHSTGANDLQKLLKSNQSCLARFPSLNDYLIQNPFKCSVQEDPEQLYSYFGVS